MVNQEIIRAKAIIAELKLNNQAAHQLTHMIAVQALEKRTAELKQKEAQIAELKAKQAYFETVAARVEALELRNNQLIQVSQ